MLGKCLRTVPKEWNAAFHYVRASMNLFCAIKLHPQCHHSTHNRSVLSNVETGYINLVSEIKQLCMKNSRHNIRLTRLHYHDQQSSQGWFHQNIYRNSMTISVKTCLSICSKTAATQVVITFTKYKTRLMFRRGTTHVSSETSPQTLPVTQSERNTHHTTRCHFHPYAFVFHNTTALHTHAVMRSVTHWWFFQTDTQSSHKLEHQTKAWRKLITW